MAWWYSVGTVDKVSPFELQAVEYILCDQRVDYGRVLGTANKTSLFQPQVPGIINIVAFLSIKAWGKI